jgi:predicted nucleic acid-binding protein
MKIIIDSNILFSAFLSDSTTRKIILEYNSVFLFPSFIFEEFEKHKDFLFRKSGMSAEDFKEFMHMIIRKVVIVPADSLYDFRAEAKEIVKDIDIDDILFIACALAHPPSMIWSDDKALKRQERVHVLNTKEMMEYLKENPDKG